MFGKCGISVTSVLLCMAVALMVSSAPVSGAIIDFAELTLGSSGFNYYTAAAGGQFGFTSTGVKLLTLQSSGATVSVGIVTSVVASQAQLLSDDSAGGEVDGTLANDAHTLTYFGYLYSGGSAPYSTSANVLPLMVAQANGLGEIAEVPASDDDIQVQYNMEIIGGGLFSGDAGHTMHANFDTTYTFNASLAGGVAPTDLSSDITFGPGDSSILMNPEPVSITLLGLGSLGLLRIRKQRT